MQNLKQNWAQYLILIIIIPALGWFLVFDRQNLKEADAKCLETSTQLCSRVDKLETTLPFMGKALDKNTEAIEKVADNVQEIKVLLIQTISKSRYGRTDDRGGMIDEYKHSDN